MSKDALLGSFFSGNDACVVYRDEVIDCMSPVRSLALGCIIRA